jgi:peroxiredoxin
MMRRALVFALAVLVVWCGLAALQAARVGEPAPLFVGTDSQGRPQRLADYRGRWVVLEWHNRECPYVRKHYDSGNMQRLQRTWTARGVAWLTVISSGVGLEGYVTAAQADAYAAEKKASRTATILDPSGDLGHLYDVKTTPQMFVINPRGVLVYNGAIDDRPSTEQGDIADAVNYVANALTEAMAGKPVTIPTSRPYGCSVKYASPKLE